jgi:ankyrin repeat protein
MANIHEAARNGNLNEVKALLNQGVPVNTRNYSGWTPLHAAAYSGRLNVVQELIKRGARVNPRSHMGGVTPLFAAAINGHPRVVHTLIKAGANPRYTTISGNSPYNITSHSDNATRNATRNALKTSQVASKFQNYRKKSIARKRASPNTLARTVFSPARVRAMMNRYGINYLNKV